MEKIKVLIVDDRDIIRDSLKLTLLRAKDIAVTGEASNGNEAISLIRKNDYDVVIMDVNMPEMNGIESTKIIKSIKPNMNILVNSMLADPENISRVLQAGASGFIDKSQPFEYEEAIRTVSNGAVFLSEDIQENTYDKVFKYLKCPSNSAVLAS
jgi:DNA-binding NarL/FixJ family response regulator